MFKHLGPTVILRNFITCLILAHTPSPSEEKPCFTNGRFEHSRFLETQGKRKQDAITEIHMH